MTPKSIKVAVAQLEVTPYNPEANLKKALAMIAQAKEKGAEIIAFPEMFLPGYLIGDLWEQEAYLNECILLELQLAAASKGIAIIYGTVITDSNRRNEDGRIRKYNAAKLYENEVCRNRVAIKTLQPNYRLFDDQRHMYDNRKRLLDAYMESGMSKGDGDSRFSQTAQTDIHSYFRMNYSPFVLSSGVRVGVVLCEDAWDTDYEFHPLDMLASKSDLIINVSCSPYTSGKNFKRHRVFSAAAKKHGKPMIYVNNVGMQDIGKTVYSFDGSSCIYDPQGGIDVFGEPFKEGLFFVDVPLGTANGFATQKTDLSGHDDDIGMLYKSIVYGLSIFVKRHGIKQVVIGASGGIDSCLVAAIMADVVGPENLWLINMPSRFNSDTTKGIARELAKRIGCRYDIVPIEEGVTLMKRQIPHVLTPYMMENVQARARAEILAAYAAAVGGVFTCNANKSEVTVGYTTINGDLAGFAAPIADLWKTQVYEMAQWISQNYNDVFPKEVFEVMPSAELSEAQDVTKGLGDPIIYSYHDKLFRAWVERWNRATPEDILDWQIKGTLEEELGYDGASGSIVANVFKGDAMAFANDVERWWKCYQGLAVAKRIVAPPIFAVSRRAFGFDHREAQVGWHLTARYHQLKARLVPLQVAVQT